MTITTVKVLLTPAPCPFCGSPNVCVAVGSSFRWRVAYCLNCGAKAGETRVQTSGGGTPEEWEQHAIRSAIENWNERREPRQ